MQCKKIEEARRVAKILEAEAIFFPYRDSVLPVNDEIKFRLAGIIWEKKAGYRYYVLEE
ncbi:MAG: hypothetical protein BSOLF_2806 [Candidatus Carbobacillus altaicus]|uniref:Uncharacterized protein n=1 Tax=Candidatus Carbonibacillus altaicus TaxID=2163959 RepID=A0A2R6Y1U8_9BACL|nr:MAG: hypothetical protein BSOLF_2806 [Candidatus Carbobacillus altaicus]